MSYPRTSKILIVHLFLAVLSCLPAAAADTETVDGVAYVRNGADARDGIEHIYLQEQWRLGGDDDEIFFGMVTRIREDEEGSLYVMDAQLSQVHVYDTQGRHLRTLFGEGEGPGEVRGPRDLVLMNDGRVGVVQEMPGKMIFVDRQGTPVGTLGIGGSGVQHGGFCQTFSAFTSGDVLLIAGFVQAPGQQQGQFVQTSFLSRFNDKGDPVAPICETVNTIDVTSFTFDEHKHLAAYWWNSAVGPDGNIYVAPHIEHYEIHVFDALGQLQKVISREHDPRRRTDAEHAEFTEAIHAIYSGMPFEVGVKTGQYDPAILNVQRGLRVHPDGTIWTLTPGGVHDQPQGVMATFDVFSPSGEYVRQVAVHGPWSGLRDGLFLFGEDHAVIITGHTDAMMAQFTGGSMSVDVEGEAATVEVIRCSLSRSD